MARAAAEDALFVERERAQITLNSIGDAVITIDKAGYVTYLNPAAERLTGWSRQEIAGRMLAEVFHLIDGDSRILSPNPMQHPTHQNKIVGLPKHAVLIRRDGGESAIEDSIAPIYDQAGQIAGAVMNTAFRMGRGIQAGRVWTNCYHHYPAHAAFGGYKQSGIGRENHKMMLDHYQQTKNVLVSYSENKLGFF